MQRTTLLSATLITLALPLAAQDGAGWTPGENFIASWDYDGDGQVTLDEVLERRGDLFAGFDDDEDGLLTTEEFANHDLMREAMWGAPGQARQQGRGYAVGDAFALLDADGDGRVGTEEFVAMGEAWFARFDPDGDGTVTAADFGPGRR